MKCRCERGMVKCFNLYHMKSYVTTVIYFFIPANNGGTDLSKLGLCIFCADLHSPFRRKMLPSLIYTLFMQLDTDP